MIYDYLDSKKNYNSFPPTKIHYWSINEFDKDGYGRLILPCGRSGNLNRVRWTPVKKLVTCKKCLKRFNLN